LIQTSNLKGTKTGIEADAMLIQNIVSAYLSDNDPSLGYAKLYVASSGGTPTTGDIANVETIIEANSKPPGTVMEYYGAVTVNVDVTATIYYDHNYNSGTVATDTEAALRRYLELKELTSDVYISEIIKTSMEVPGVLNVKDVELNAAADDLEIDNTEIARPGTITVEVL